MSEAAGGAAAALADGVEDCAGSPAETAAGLLVALAGCGDVEVDGAAQHFGTSGLGAETPAILEPRPSFCSVGASSLPVESRPWADWNFSVAAIVFESHLPEGSP